MGLDLSCLDMTIKMGSYTSVHTQRIGFLKAEAKRFRSLGMTAEADRILRSIRAQGGIDYDAVHKNLRPILHPGLYAFVHHSDYDGVWTSDESSQILDAMAQLESFLPHITELRPYLTKNKKRRTVYHLEPILRLSRSTGEDVHFV